MGYETEQELLFSQVIHNVCNFTFTNTLKGCYLCNGNETCDHLYSWTYGLEFAFDVMETRVSASDGYEGKECI
jgi:hypothetical protein